MPRLPEDPIARYRALVVRYFDDQDVRKANWAYDQRAALRRELHRAGDDESRRLLTLLEDPHPGVRYAAAFEALSLEPREGLRVLRELASGPPGPVRFRAWHTLKLYEEGTMDLQPWNKSEPDDER